MDDIKTVLLLDDQKNIREDLELWLKKIPLHVHIASSVKKAKNIIKSSQIHFAIIDLKLDYNSEFGGIEIVHLVRKHHKSAKIIILTAYSLDNVIKEMNKDDYDAYVSKGGPENYITAVLSEINKFQDE